MNWHALRATKAASTAPVTGPLPHALHMVLWLGFPVMEWNLVCGDFVTVDETRHYGARWQRALRQQCMATPLWPRSRSTGPALAFPIFHTMGRPLSERLGLYATRSAVHWLAGSPVVPSGLRTVALVIFGALFMLASRCGSATMTFEVVNHMTQQYSWWEDDQFECGVYWPIGWIAVSGHPDDSLGEQLGYSHTCFSYSVEVAALMGYFVAWILVYSTGLCRWKWSVKRLPVAGMSDKRRRLVATECQERKNMVPSSVSAMDARRQPAPALALSALRRRVNVDVGIGMLFAVIAMLVPHLVGMQFRMLNRIIPVALVAANTAFVLGAYHHVRLRGYHGLWALVAFLGPVLDGFLLALCLFPHLGFGESADWAARGLIQFSGLAALVFLPQRQMPSSPVPDSDAP